MSFKRAVLLPLLNTAENARIHTSKCLTEQALCHATGCATPDIMKGKLQGGCFEDNMHVIIEQKVCGSMKNVEYKTKAVITPIHFLAAECSCRSGCSNKPSPNIAPADV